MQVKRNNAFSDWFQDSVVRTSRGIPKVVYHGSRSPWVDRFSSFYEGTGVVRGLSQPKRRNLFWFTSNRSNAEFYSDRAPKKQALGYAVHGGGGQFFAEAHDRRGNGIFVAGPWPTFEAAEAGGRLEMERYNRSLRTDTFVLPVYLRLQNPLILQSVVPRNGELAQALEGGHDGIVAIDVIDGSHVSDCYVVFSPHQVKHVRNEGSWSQEDSNIRN